MIRTKGEAGTGNVVEAVRHMRAVDVGDPAADDPRPRGADDRGEEPRRAVRARAPASRPTGKLPVPNFAAGGIATPADAALMMQLGAEAVFVGSGIFKSDDPARAREAIVRATTHFEDPKVVAEVSRGLGRRHARDRDLEAPRVGAAPDARLVTWRCAIGVLALQGDFAAHAAGARGPRARRRRGAPRRASSTGLDGLVLPGGESTTLLNLMARRAVVRRAPQRSTTRGGALLGTCAGAILLAREVVNPAQPSLGLLDADDRAQRLRPAGRLVRDDARRAGARRDRSPPSSSGRRASARSARASTCSRATSGEPVLVREGSVLALTFHPELTGDTRLHQHPRPRPR